MCCLLNFVLFSFLFLLWKSKEKNKRRTKQKLCVVNEQWTGMDWRLRTEDYGLILLTQQSSLSLTCVITGTINHTNLDLKLAYGFWFTPFHLYFQSIECFLLIIACNHRMIGCHLLTVTGTDTVTGIRLNIPLNCCPFCVRTIIWSKIYLW